ncbi:MAG: tRNA pseudouridine(55) synthase TruB [Candidatus Omnitrophota bacterium]
MTEDPIGILVVDKEKGMTSHDVVKMVRRRFSIKKVGHAGTLDPGATGVLVLLLGRATKLSGKYSGEEKEYVAVMKLGQKTDTGDMDGTVTLTRDVAVSGKEIAEAVNSFIGEVEQTPPMVSAKKVNGRRLYKLARKGVEVERKPQKIFIEDIEVIKTEIPFVTFRTVCSKGTYIRQLAEDIGEKLGCGAHLTELRRTRSGSFSLDGSIPFSELSKLDREKFDANIIRVQEP